LFLPTTPPVFVTGSEPPAPGGGTTAASGPTGVTGLAKTGTNPPQAASPAPQMLDPFGNTLSSSSSPENQGSNETTYFVDNNAKEKKRGTATNVVANPLAAPPVEDYQVPLARLFGAAGSDGSHSHWWVWLLLALLLAAAAYVYSRWKKYYESERDED
jgi:hypothetical protein